MDLARYIRNIPDFPKSGIQFKDITPLLANPEAFRAAIQQMAAMLADRPYDAVAATYTLWIHQNQPLRQSLHSKLTPSWPTTSPSRSATR